MNKFLRGLSATTMLLVAASVSAATLQVRHAWIRVLPEGLPAAGYARLENQGDTPIALVGALSAAYRAVMLHRSVTTGGMSRMTMVRRLTVPAHGTASLSPGGYHMMLMHPLRPIKPGDHVKLTLLFADGSRETVEFLARPANASGDR